MSAPLALIGDEDPARLPTVRDYLAGFVASGDMQAATARAIEAVLSAATALAHRLALGDLPGVPGRLVGTNTDGDQQKALDVGANDLFIRHLAVEDIAYMISEEAEEPIALRSGGQLAIALDPVDGSGNIGIGAPLGTLFSIFAADGDFADAGRRQLASGYVAYGHTVDCGLTVGDGVMLATLDHADGEFRVHNPRVRLPSKTSDVAINASNARHWTPGVASYIADCYAGKTGPRGRDFNTRWLGAAVGELHRILQRGGIFLYPLDNRPGYERGRLRLVYEAWPIAFLIEQAGGRATDGRVDILKIPAANPHQRTPLVFGSRDEVDAFTSHSRAETPAA